MCQVRTCPGVPSVGDLTYLLMQVPATLRQETPTVETPVVHGHGGIESLCPSPSDLGEKFEAAAMENEVRPMVPVALVPVVVEDIPPSQPRLELPDSPGHAAGDSEDESELIKAPEPPPQLSDNAVKARLRRVFLPRADGSYLVPEDLVKEYKNINTRDRIKSLYEKCGYNSDGFENRFSWR